MRFSFYFCRQINSINDSSLTNLTPIQLVEQLKFSIFKVFTLFQDKILANFALTTKDNF